MNNKYSDLGFLFEAGATEDLIQRTLQEVGKPFLSAYLDFLNFSNGATGTFVILYPVEEVLNYLESYMAEYVPGFLVIGSNGGGEAYGFNLNVSSLEIVMIPWIGGGWEDAVHCGTDFLEFLKKASAGFSLLEGKMFEVDD